MNPAKQIHALILEVAFYGLVRRIDWIRVYNGHQNIKNLCNLLQATIDTRLFE